MHPLAPPWPALDDARARLVLRDGSVASVRPAAAADAAALERFFHDLSPESRRQRFFAAGEASQAVIERLAAPAAPSDALTLVAERVLGGAPRIVAVGSYVRVDRDAAEVAFAVADDFHGKGLGTALLERLAVVAAAQGFRRFQASTLADNAAMLEVFRDSGFQVRSSASQGCVDVELSLSRSLGSAAAEEERRRLATTASLRPLLVPQSVAVVGASRDTSSIGRRVLDAILAVGFHGPVYPVNPHASEVAGLPALASARDLPRAVDLAVITVPARAVETVVTDCADAGVKSLVIISAGFAEAGPEGRALQERLVETVRLRGMRMVGPNCMGLLNTSPRVRLNASFSPIFPPGGKIGLLSQSGALGLAIIRLAGERHLGLSTFVSVGNKADVSGNDLLEYWEGDPDTSVVLLYLESFGNPRRFARLARRVGRSKPIVVVKSGRSRSGSRAATSHTAALAASDAVVDALFRQTGVVRADTLDEMFDIAACLDLQPLPPGRRVAVVTNAGGPGILAADACEAAGLTLPELPPATRSELAACLPPMASSVNPVDLVASAGPVEYARAIQAVLRAPDIDALIVIYTPVDASSSAVIVEAIRKGVAEGRRAGVLSKPVLACVMAEGGPPVPLAIGPDGGERLPTYAFPENTARALGKVAAYAEWRRRDPGELCGFDDIRVEEARRICRLAAAARGSAWLTAEEVDGVLHAFGLPQLPGRLARTPEEAAAAAHALGFPVAAKLASTRVQHKSDIGGVRLGLADEAAVRQAFGQILDAVAAPGDQGARSAGEAPAVLIQPMAPRGIETMMGVTNDPLFGPLVAFGLGGVDVEVLGDVQFRIAPLTDRDAHEMVHGIRAARLLAGYRGRSAADVPALQEALLRLSRLAEEVPELAELDLNPVVALAPGEGCRILDARIRVQPLT